MTAVFSKTMITLRHSLTVLVVAWVAFSAHAESESAAVDVLDTSAATSTSDARAVNSSKLKLSTFGRIVAGRINDSDMEFFSYDDEWRANRQSLIGFRLDTEFTDKLTLVTQGVGYTSNSREDGITQLYFNYSPVRSTNIRVGRTNTALFNLSESYDIGFTYPWITPPQQVYSEFLFINMDGILLNYGFGNVDIAGDIDVYWGQYGNEFVIAGASNFAESKHSQGIALNIYKDNWHYRASYHSSHFEIQIKQTGELREALVQVGFQDIANFISDTGEIKILQAGVHYDNVDYFFRSEWTKLKTDIYIMPEIESAYATLGLNYYPYSIYATLAWSDLYYPPVSNGIPLGLNPQLDVLKFLVDDLSNVLADDSLVSLSLGARYDFSHNIAFKLETTVLNGEDNQRGLFNVFSENNPEREAMLFQVAIEWVF